MHRVELKGDYIRLRFTSSEVPNAPCGVESVYAVMALEEKATVFLMHRVELKVPHPKMKMLYCSACS